MKRIRKYEASIMTVMFLLCLGLVSAGVLNVFMTSDVTVTVSETLGSNILVNNHQAPYNQVLDVYMTYNDVKSYDYNITNDNPVSVRVYYEDTFAEEGLTVTVSGLTGADYIDIPAYSTEVITVTFTTDMWITDGVLEGTITLKP